MFISMMENYERVTELTNAGLQSQGELAKANEIRVNSLSGQMNILNDKMLSFMDGLQPAIYGSVKFGNALLDVVNFIGAIPTAVGLATTSFLNFNETGRALRDTLMNVTGSYVPFIGNIQKLSEEQKNNIDITKLNIAGIKADISARKMQGLSVSDLVVNLKAEETALKTTQIQLALTTAKTIALQAAMSMGLSIAIGLVVSGITKMISGLKTASEKMDEARDNFNSLTSTMEDIKEAEFDIEMYKQLHKQLETIGDDELGRLEILQKIKDIESSSGSSLEGYSAIIQNDNLKLETKLTLLEGIRQKELEIQALSLKESMASEKQMKEELGYLNLAMQKYEEYKNAIANTREDGNVYFEDGQYMSLEQARKEMEDYSNAVRDSYITIEEYNSMCQALSEVLGEELAPAMIQLTDTQTNFSESIINASKSSENTKEIKTEIGALADALSTLNEENSKFNASNIENATDSYVELAQKARNIQSVIDEINENGIHLDVLDSASSYMEKFSGNIGNASEVVEHLNSVLQATQEEAYLIYANLLSNDSEYWESANANSESYFENNIKNTEEWANYQQQVYNQLMKLHAIMVETMGGNYSGYFQTIAEGLQIDLANCKSAAEAKVKIEEKAQTAITEMRNAAIQAFVKEQSAINDSLQAQGIDGLTSAAPNLFSGSSGAEYKNALASIKKWRDSAIASIQGIDALVNTAPKFTSSIGNMSDSLSSASKEAEKLVADLEDIADAYYDISNALKTVENALEQNRTEQGYATPQRLVELYKQEVELLKEKQDLLLQNKQQAQKEADSLKQYLSSQGFSFKGEDISNYSSRFDSLQKWANSLTGDDKESAIEYVESLMESVERYTDLVKDEIPDITNEWMDMTNQIKEAEKEMAQAVTDAQKDIASAIENALNKRYNLIKKELEKEKELYEKQYEEEDYEDSLNEEQRKLDEIRQQISDLSRDSSIAGQLKLQQLRAEYEAQQKVIDEMIRDHEREQGSNRFDEEMDKLDEELENQLSADNIADLVNKALVNGFVTIGDEVVELNSLMTDWLSETGDGLYAIGDILREELISQLQTAKELLAGMGITTTTPSKTRSLDTTISPESYDYNSSAMNNLSKKVGRASQVVQEINLGSLLNVEGSVTEDILPKVESMLSRAKNEIFNNIAKQLSYK